MRGADTGALREDQIHHGLHPDFSLRTGCGTRAAAETFRYFREQGVSIRVISATIPKQCPGLQLTTGHIEGADQFVDAPP